MTRRPCHCIENRRNDSFDEKYWHRPMKTIILMCLCVYVPTAQSNDYNIHRVKKRKKKTRYCRRETNNGTRANRMFVVHNSVECLSCALICLDYLCSSIENHTFFNTTQPPKYNTIEMRSNRKIKLLQMEAARNKEKWDMILKQERVYRERKKSERNYGTF